ncbi:MAG: proline dehydrogenase family protein [Bacteroidota bacterium]|nr:proline dehydrogenase family protein [Bacteroidota bacterium]
MENHFSDTELAFKHLSDGRLRKSILLYRLFQRSWVTKLGSFLLLRFLYFRFPIENLIKKTVFSQFCAGETLEESHKTALLLAQSRVGSILDYSAEGEQHEKGFESNALQLQNAIRKAAQHPNVYPFAVFKSTAVGSTAILTKVTLGLSLEKEEKNQFQNWKNRMKKICALSASLDLPIFIDAEESYIQGAIDDLVLGLMKTFNKEKPMIYNTVQLYRKEGLDIVKKFLEQAKQDGFFLGFKLVRGAYLEKEQKWASENQRVNPINENKKMTDDMFDDAVILCMNNLDIVSFCAGTHNEKSTLKIMDMMKKMNLNNEDKRIWFAQLLGMSDNLSFVLASNKYNCAKYLPFGPIREVMPYLIRRAEENSAVSGQMGRELTLLLQEKKRRKLWF